MTAAEAAASTRTRKAIIEQAAVIDHVSLSDKLVRDILLGWPSRADNRRIVLDAAQVCGVDVATIPAHSPAEVAAWTARRRGAGGESSPRIDRLVESIAEHRRRYAKLRAFAARIVEQCRYTDEEVDRFQREADTYRARVAELEAQLAATLPPNAIPTVTRTRAELVERYPHPTLGSGEIRMDDGSPVPD